jgi:hypothetical protein
MFKFLGKRISIVLHADSNMDSLLNIGIINWYNVTTMLLLATVEINFPAYGHVLLSTKEFIRQAGNQ